MNNLLATAIEYLSEIDNTIIFALSIIPYSFFLFYLYKIKSVNLTIKIGFTLTLFFVLITIVFSVLSLNLYNKTLVEVDIFHGSAEVFLTISDFVILLGFIKILESLEVKNS